VGSECEIGRLEDVRAVGSEVTASLDKGGSEDVDCVHEFTVISPSTGDLGVREVVSSSNCSLGFTDEQGEASNAGQVTCTSVWGCVIVSKEAHAKLSCGVGVKSKS
jgi:hypothetical protein